jgi:hypothetical protein
MIAGITSYTVHITSDPVTTTIWLVFCDLIILYIPLPSSLLSKNAKVRLYKTIILPVVLYECETWSLTLRAEQ